MTNKEGSKGTVLITDSLFISKKNEKQIKDAGYMIERIEEPKVAEGELVKAIQDKIGYILGGTEKVTSAVINAADHLKALVVTAIDYSYFIEDISDATDRGIGVSNTPESFYAAVSESGLTMALTMNRGVFEIGRMGQKKFLTTPGLFNLDIGFIGYGRIGQYLTRMLQPFGTASISYFNRSRKEVIEEEYGVIPKSKEKIFEESDIIFVCIPSSAGDNFVGEKEIKTMKSGALVVNVSHPGAIDYEALLDALQIGNIRAAADYPASIKGLDKLPLSTWYCHNASNAFNTISAIQSASDAATKSLLNLLETGDDAYKVN